jgi:hypothetical protein
MSVTNAGTYVGIQTSADNVVNRLGSGASLHQKLMMVLATAKQITQGQMKDQIEEMQNRNEWLAEANAAMAAMRAARPASQDGGAVSYGTFTTASGQTKNVHDWMTENGIAIETTGNDKIGKQTEFDQAIQNLKGAMDTVNNNSQLDLMRYQGLNDMDGQLTEQMTTELKSHNQRNSSIIRNTGG